jgi:hypothetical protein
MRRAALGLLHHLTPRMACYPCSAHTMILPHSILPHSIQCMPCI